MSSLTIPCHTMPYHTIPYLPAPRKKFADIFRPKHRGEAMLNEVLYRNIGVVAERLMMEEHTSAGSVQLEEVLVIPVNLAPNSKLSI